jgi:uncharacterized protein
VIRTGFWLLAGCAAGSWSAQAQPAPAPAVTAGGASQSLSESQIRTVLADAWRDATLTWARVLGQRIYESELPQINFVQDIRPSHCYGLYVGTGPVYCSGNNTVFVSLSAMERLSVKIGADTPAGLAILVAHELGHHVQKITGRFRVLAGLARAEPRLMRELSLKFELEADCLAGVWARQSGGYASRPDVRDAMLDALSAIGDDRMQLAERGTIDEAAFTHGTSEQRLRWYNAGFDAGEKSICNVLESDDY